MPGRPGRPSRRLEPQGRTGPARIPSRYVECRDRPCLAECKGRGFLPEGRLPVARSRGLDGIVSSGLGQAARATGLPTLPAGELLEAPAAPRQVGALASERRLSPPRLQRG